MTSYVVDTNVAIVANRQNVDADLECQLACVEKLESVCREEAVVGDDQDFIFNEYKARLSFSGPPREWATRSSSR